MQRLAACTCKQWVFAFLVLALACLRLCHIHLLWADEDYHLAASIAMLHGKVPYRDFWYDKPPLSAFYYLLIGGYSGWPLRILDAAYVCAACWLMFRLARAFWSDAEAWTAALLLAFYMAFYLPSAVIPFAADALMIVPHLAAVYCAQRNLPFWAGACTGVAFLANTKAIFVFATCALWIPLELPLLVAGFFMVSSLALLSAFVTGSWPGYYEQVWRWGLVYARQPPVAHPVLNGLVRTADWLGFHAALGVGAVVGILRVPGRDRWRLGVWTLFSFAAVALGWRFAPHYFLQLLPALVILAARGIVFVLARSRRFAVIALVLLLSVPLIRFGPRYVSLAYDDALDREPHWIDIAMNLDSQQVSRQIRTLRHSGDTLFVWGYRPDMYVYTRMIPDGRFLDSQPLTGVPADRHLHAAEAVYSGPAAVNRQELAQSKPTFLVDGLSLLNPKLAPNLYPELRPWLTNYRLVARTKMSLIYKRISD